MFGELSAPTNATGRVLAGVLAEIGAIPSELQHPELVAEALRYANILDNPECVSVAPAAFGRMAALLNALHEGVDE
jgi:hypothetical protein